MTRVRAAISVALLCLAGMLPAGVAAADSPAPAPPMTGGVEPDRESYRIPTDEERKSAIAAIEAQLVAFRRDDYELAAHYQSRELQFRSAEQFRRAIQDNYPQFARSKAAVFGNAIASQSGDRMFVALTLEGVDGVTVWAIYEMTREAGEYRVAGVRGGSRSRPAPQDIA